MESICLNEIEVAGMVDYLFDSTIQPDNEILQHLENCYKCKQEVVENWMLLKTVAILSCKIA